MPNADYVIFNGVRRPWGDPLIIFTSPPSFVTLKEDSTRAQSLWDRTGKSRRWNAVLEWEGKNEKRLAKPRKNAKEKMKESNESLNKNGHMHRDTDRRTIDMDIDIDNIHRHWQRHRQRQRQRQRHWHRHRRRRRRRRRHNIYIYIDIDIDMDSHTNIHILCTQVGTTSRCFSDTFCSFS